MYQKRKKKCKSFLIVSVAFMMAFSAFYVQADENSHLAGTNQILRILLRRLNITQQMEIAVNGSYALQSTLGMVVLPQGSKVTLRLNGGQLYVYTQGAYWNGGEALSLIRHQQEEGKENGLRLNGGENLYEGDLYLSVSGEIIEPILHVHLEDYLMGVVPYEMSDSFPLEALKAQAIAARTYAISKVNPKAAYDLVDTTNDQVFKGKNPENIRSQQAIRETAGICGTYQGGFAMCYYTASNGGQTELASHIWGGKDPGYIIMQDDPYDFQNPQSPVRKSIIPKKPNGDQQGLDGWRWVLSQALQDTLIPKGYSTHWEHLRIDSVQNMKLENPKFKSPSRLYANLTVTFSYSAKTILTGANGSIQQNASRKARAEKNTFQGVVIQKLSNAAGPTPTPFFAGPPVEGGNSGGEIDFFQTPAPEVIPNQNNQQENQPAATSAPVPQATATLDPYSYSEFIQEPEPVTVTLNLFPQVDAALGISLNQNGNELMELEETGDQFVLYARRFGHGVGMSQRGAEQMAGQGKTWQEILAFYYPGMGTVTLNQSPVQLNAIDQALANTPGPLPTATPRPTPMPVTQPLEEGWRMGVVDNIEESSYLNLRKEPSTAAEVIMQLFKGQNLIILPTQTEQGWYHVKTDVIEGYVAQEFVQIMQQ